MEMLRCGCGLAAIAPLRPLAASRVSRRPRAPKDVRAVMSEGDEGVRNPNKDTRIHWGSSTDGWIGTADSPTDYSSGASESVSAWRGAGNDALMGLLVQASDSHYRYLGLTPDADTEEIKAAYRRLSKTYHPDTTSLPLEVAAQKFVRLKEAYTVLSSEQERRFYDWQLAQEISSLQEGRFSWPYEASRTQNKTRPGVSEVYDPINDSREPVDTLGGKNMDLSDQALSALAFDAFALAISLIAIICVVFLKQ